MPAVGVFINEQCKTIHYPTGQVTNIKGNAYDRKSK